MTWFRQQLNSQLMHNHHDNSVLRTLLILCISLALLFSQINLLHMHIEHNDHSNASDHIVDVHTATLMHDFDLILDDHHSVAVDISPDNLSQTVNSLNPQLFILFFVGLLLILSPLLYSVRQKLFLKYFTRRYYLLQPPLRAPPLI